MTTNPSSMTGIALVYGGLSGLVVISSMMAGLLFSGGEGFYASQWFGYLIMLIALSLIFLGVKRHRDVERGGVIKFSQALLMGVLIAAVAGVMYVAVWEIYLIRTDYAFIDNYVAGVLETKQAAGLAGAELEAEIAKLNQLKEQYANPLLRLPITFMEIFPIGFVIALVSAALLRRPEFMPDQA